LKPDPLEPVFKALASPWRRKILDMLREGPLTTSDLHAALPELSRFAVMQHLTVLEEANLIIARREGRQRFNHLNAVPIRQVYERWVSNFEGHWAGALLSLKAMLEAPDTPGDDRRADAKPSDRTTRPVQPTQPTDEPNPRRRHSPCGGKTKRKPRPGGRADG
jgi:DNA-binding transcriptional ArsR family regulator